jgi:hypothetical protein
MTFKKICLPSMASFLFFRKSLPSIAFRPIVAYNREIRIYILVFRMGIMVDFSSFVCHLSSKCLDKFAYLDEGIL